jgi:hypothetical protein
MGSTEAPKICVGYTGVYYKTSQVSVNVGDQKGYSGFGFGSTP